MDQRLPRRLITSWGARQAQNPFHESVRLDVFRPHRPLRHTSHKHRAMGVRQPNASSREKPYEIVEDLIELRGWPADVSLNELTSRSHCVDGVWISHPQCPGVILRIPSHG